LDHIAKVTLEDVNEFVARYLKKDQSLVAITKPEAIKLSPTLLEEALG